MAAAAIIALCFTATAARAFEPPRISVATSLQSGETAFIVRVTGLDEVDRKAFETIAVARTSVVLCLYGKSCTARWKPIIRFTLDTTKERALGVNLSLGREYLFVLKKMARGARLTFGSDWSKPIDAAYLLRTPLKPLYGADEVVDIEFENVWGGGRERIAKAVLMKLAAARSAELRQ